MSTQEAIYLATFDQRGIAAICTKQEVNIIDKPNETYQLWIKRYFSNGRSF